MTALFDEALDSLEPPADPFDIGTGFDDTPKPKYVKEYKDIVPTNGTVEIFLPGELCFGVPYGSIHVTVPIGNVADLPQLLEQKILAVGTAAYDIVKQYAAANNAPAPSRIAAGGYAAQVSTQAPVPNPVPQALAPVAGFSQGAIAGVAAGTAAPGASTGTVQIQTQYKMLTVPTLEAIDTDTFRNTAIAQAQAALGIPAEFLVAYDNRADLLSGQAKGSSIGAVKFSKQAPVQVTQSFVTARGAAATLAWIDFSGNQVNVKATKEFTAARPFILAGLGVTV